MEARTNGNAVIVELSVPESADIDISPDLLKGWMKQGTEGYKQILRTICKSLDEEEVRDSERRLKRGLHSFGLGIAVVGVILLLAAAASGVARLPVKEILHGVAALLVLGAVVPGASQPNDKDRSTAPPPSWYPVRSPSRLRPTF